MTIWYSLFCTKFREFRSIFLFFPIHLLSLISLYFLPPPSAIIAYHHYRHEHYTYRNPKHILCVYAKYIYTYVYLLCKNVRTCAYINMSPFSIQVAGLHTYIFHVRTYINLINFHVTWAGLSYPTVNFVLIRKKNN